MVEGGLLLAALLGAVAVARLLARGPWAATTEPLVVTAAVGFLVPAVLLRTRVPTRPARQSPTEAPAVTPILSAPMGLVAVLLAATWTTVGGATRDGLPTANTVGVLRHELARARAALHGFHLPVAPRPGVQFLAALLVGLAGVAAHLALRGDFGGDMAGRRGGNRSAYVRTASGRRRRPLMAMLPATALVTWSVAALGGTGADLLAAGTAALGAAVVLAELPAPLPSSRPGTSVRTDDDNGPRGRPGGGAGGRGHRMARSFTRRARPAGSGVALALISIGLALAVADLAGTSGPAPPGSSSAGGAGHGRPSTGPATGSEAVRVPPTSLSLATDLVGLEAQDPTVRLFTVASPVSTYWQVATLTDFEAGQWSASPATLAALRTGAPPAEPTVLPTAGRAAFVARVTLDQFSSRLLPVPPDTLGVTVNGGADVTGAGVVVPSPDPGGTTYQTTSVVAPSVVATPAGGAGPGVAGSGVAGSGVAGSGVAGSGVAGSGVAAGASLLPAAVQATDLALLGLPSTVRRLAAQVTAGATTPLARAEALEDWFRSGRFRYRLPSPPTAPRGHPAAVADPAAAMVRFLEVTREGSCQDFAGAYAAMARVVGLPARVAVGFTAGRRLPPSARAPAGFVTSVVQGADAHAWPEVYLGTALGWVSFEPTPARPAGQLSPEGVIGPSGRTVVPTGPATGTATSTPTPTTTAPTASSTSKPSDTTPTSGPAGSRGSRSATPAPVTTEAGGGWPVAAWATLGVALALLLGLLAAVVLPLVMTGATLPTARCRSRRAREHPSLAVLDAYRAAQRALAPLGLAAPPTGSPVRHAENLVALTALAGPAVGRRAASAADAPMEARGDRPPDAGLLASALGDGLLLAQALEQVCFASEPATGEQASEAYLGAARLRRALRRRGVRRLARQLAAVSRRPRTRAPEAQSPRTGRNTSPV